MSETDRELLELAAKAAGLQVVWHEPDDDSEPWCFIPDCHPPHNRRQRDKWSGTVWNPLADDGDALRLAVKLNMMEEGSKPFVELMWRLATENGADDYAATRRAIVRAAAEIGRSMK
jgi:hypothetical protein